MLPVLFAAILGVTLLSTFLPFQFADQTARRVRADVSRAAFWSAVAGVGLTTVLAVWAVGFVASRPRPMMGSDTCPDLGPTSPLLGLVVAAMVANAVAAGCAGWSARGDRRNSAIALATAGLAITVLVMFVALFASFCDPS